MACDNCEETKRQLAEFRAAEKKVSDAYVRLRIKLGALDTPFAPTPEQIYEHTEAKLDTALREKAEAELQLESLRPLAAQVTPLSNRIVGLQQRATEAEAFADRQQRDAIETFERKNAEIVALNQRLAEAEARIGECYVRLQAAGFKEASPILADVVSMLIFQYREAEAAANSEAYEHGRTQEALRHALEHSGKYASGYNAGLAAGRRTNAGLLEDRMRIAKERDEAEAALAKLRGESK